MDKIFASLLSVRWQDVFDITLNSYILFRLYVLFRRTNVFRVLIGIACLWFFQRIAVSLGLILTSWVIGGITAAAALIIIVVFRNEIRSYLQAEKIWAILWGFPRKAIDTPVQIILESVFEMARRHTGALIVVPGKDDLEEVIQTGVTWDGAISKEMLISIFWPDNPVHDGAAIVQGTRLTKVGVVLPLSRRNDLPSHYGTRHRAALGLTETTDALAIVVSEERGQVIVSKGSQIHLINNRDELSSILQDHLGIAQENLGRLKREKVELAAAALASLVLITGVWFSFTRGFESLVTLEVPIEYMNRRSEIEIVDTSVNATHVYLSGSGALIRSIQPEQIHVRLDLAKGVVGHNTFTITPEDITLPPGIILTKVKPRVVEVKLDVLTEKSLPVQVDWTGRLPRNLVMTQLVITPETVRIIGGRQVLNSVSTVYTEKLRLDSINKSGKLTAKLALNPTSIRFASGSNENVRIDYVIKKKF